MSKSQEVSDAQISAYFYGGLAVVLEKEGLAESAGKARRSYWRRMAAIEALMGRPSAEAEKLGAEP